MDSRPKASDQYHAPLTSNVVVSVNLGVHRNSCLLVDPPLLTSYFEVHPPLAIEEIINLGFKWIYL